MGLDSNPTRGVETEPAHPRRSALGWLCRPGGGRRGFHAAAPATGRAGSCERRQRSDRAGRESEGRGGPRVAAGQVRRGGVSISRAGGRRRDRRGRTEGREEPKAALFQSVDAAGRRLTGRALQRRVVLAMIKRRPAAAGRPPSTCCNTFRATGITAYSVERRDPRARAADRGARVPRRQRSSTTGPRTRSPSTRSSGS